MYPKCPNLRVPLVSCWDLNWCSELFLVKAEVSRAYLTFPKAVLSKAMQTALTAWAGVWIQQISYSTLSWWCLVLICLLWLSKERFCSFCVSSTRYTNTNNYNQGCCWPAEFKQSCTLTPYHLGQDQEDHRWSQGNMPNWTWAACWCTLQHM